MAEAVLRLDADDVWRALETVDPVEVLAEELIKRAIGHRTGEPTRGLVPWAHADHNHADEYVLSEDRSRDLRCAMPAASLRMVHAAALSALATRELLVPGGVTMAVLGTRAAIQAHLGVLARHVPDVVHVAVRVTDRADAGPLEPRLTDQLDFAGIGLSVRTTPADALFGANLVVAVSPDVLSGEPVTVNHLVRGTVLVNASGHDLPAALTDHVDQVYVDDLALLPAHADRHVVAQHLARTSDTARAGDQVHPPAIAADLGLLLAGARPGRERQDDIVAVELLSANAPDPHLANTIAETARRRGLGVRVPA